VAFRSDRTDVRYAGGRRDEGKVDRRLLHEPASVQFDM
jgi:hypothetical protein